MSSAVPTVTPDTLIIVRVLISDTFFLEKRYLPAMSLLAFKGFGEIVVRTEHSLRNYIA